MSKQAMVLGMLVLCATAFGGMKVGTVDMMMLVRHHPSYESNKKLLQGTEKDYQRDLDTLKASLDEIQDEGRKLADELKNPMLAESAKKATEGKIMEVQQRFIRKQQELRNEAMKNQQRLSELEARLLKAQAEDLKARISKYAEKEDYDLIVDVAAAMFARKDLDVTDEILRAMNVDPKAARAKENDEGK